MNKIIRFLGGVSFACILIALAALFVITGTLIEAKTESHALAEKIIYNGIAFKLLLCGFFINILISALRRYPFQKKHIPFLITHLGLLMIISGVFIKSLFGVQGAMVILEGGISDSLILPQTYSVQIERHSPKKAIEWDMQKGPLQIDGLTLRLLHQEPHGEEIFHTFFKDDFVHILGFPPIPIQDTGKAVMALKVNDPIATFKEQIKKRARISLNEIPLKDFEIAEISPLTLKLANEKKISADDKDFQIQIEPLLLFMLDANHDTHIFSIDATGAVTEETLPYNTLKTVQLFDDGFQGMAVQVPLGKTGFSLEAPITRQVHPKKAPLKLEDRHPTLTLEIKEGDLREVKTLVYDPGMQGLKVPALYGKYLLHFRPKTLKLPHQIRMRRAFHIPYPGSSQALSYEADLFVDGAPQKLSMNQVHETNKGYRLYLAGLQPKEEIAVKKAHLVINRDPARLFLTFPGGALVALGIFLLFFYRPSLLKSS